MTAQTAATAAVATTTAVKTGWWARQSTTVKVLVIIGGIGVLTSPLWAQPLYRKLTGAPKKGSDPHQKTENSSVSGNNQPKTQEAIEHIPTSLPNNGEGCSEVYQLFDRNNDFVKCAGIWYIKTKPNPANEKMAGKFPQWTSLANNEVLTARLNERYPQTA